MRSDLALIAVIVATLTLMVVPLNQDIIDALLTLNISLSVLLLMVAIYLKNPSDFSTFPSVILIGTAFRLALSVGTTRLILSEADAGSIIETFGDFVVSGSIGIGLVIFLIITVVQFLVVTKGAERVAEVGARFALDALPGKQMAIDAEVRAGSLDASEATMQRKKLDKESQFFGAMDGAMKFVKGDAIAGLIIICINLIGGVSVGISLHGYSFGEAVGIFSLLTVGDGLVAQVPALLMSLCAGVIVTRVANQDGADLGTEISNELVSDPRVPMVAAMIVLAIGFIPGFPVYMFGFLAAVLLITSILLRRAIRRRASDEEKEDLQVVDQTSGDETDEMASLPESRRFHVKVGTSLAQELDLKAVNAVNSERFADLAFASGVRFERPQIVDSDALDRRSVVIEMDDVPLFCTEIPPDACFIAENGDADLEAGSVKRFDAPVLPGYWHPNSARSELEQRGLNPVQVGVLLVDVAFLFYEQNLGKLFSINAFNELMGSLSAEEPELMALISEEMTQAAFLRMFRYLIEDGVPIRPASLFASSLHHWIHTAQSPSSASLAECLRGSMARQLCHRIAGSFGTMGLAMVDFAVEEMARANLPETDWPNAGSENQSLVFPRDISADLLSQFQKLDAAHSRGIRQTAVVVSADLRRAWRNFLAANHIHIPVLSPHEVVTEVPSVPVDLIKLSRNST